MFQKRYLVQAFSLILALLSFGAAFAADALTPDKWYVVDSWQQRQGLPQNFVRSVLQTRDGYIWVGTNAGLARFDGVRFTTFDNRDHTKLRENEIRKLLEGDDGSLWIGTFGGGLTHFKDGKIQVYTTDDGLIHNFIETLAKDREGSIWIGTERGIGRYKDGHFSDFKGVPGAVGSTLRIFCDDDGSIWIGTTDGGFHLYKDGKFSPQSIDGKTPGSKIRTILRSQSPDKSLWVGTTDGLFKIEKDRTTKFTMKDGLSSNSIEYLLLENDGKLWIATDKGVDQYFPETTSFGSVFRGADVNSICRDQEGSMWVGFTRAGLIRLLPGKFTSYTTKDGLSHSYATTVLQDRQGTIWAGTQEGLNGLKDGVVTTIEPHRGLPKAFVGSIAEDKDGRLWVGTAAGLYRSLEAASAGGAANGLQFMAIKDEAIPKTLFFRTIYPTRDGAVWISLDQEGLLRYQNGHFVRYTTQDGLSSNLLRGLAEDRDGSLWIGTRGGGLNHFKDGKFTVYTQRDGLANDSVVALYMDADNALWIGTRQGMHRLKAGKLTTYTVDNGLFSNFVLSIVEDNKGDLWMGCRNGLFHVSKQQLNDFADGKITKIDSVAYGTEHGLSSTAAAAGHQPSSLLAKDGRVWFALDGGISVVDPEKILANSAPPPVHLEHVSIDRVDFDLAEKIDAPPGRGDIVISYAGLSYLAPEKVRFKYRLEGYDRDWVDAGDRRAAFYSNIPPGRYKFQVIAANNDGVWNDKGASLILMLAPHFYETGWFYGLCAGTAGLAIFGGLRLRVRSLRVRERQLESVVSERTSELQRQKENMQRQRSFLRKVIDLNPSFIFAKDREGRFTLGNQALADAYGVTVDELIGKTEADFNSHAEEVERIRAEELKVFDSKSEPVMREELITDRSGKQHWRQIIKIPLVSPDDQSRQLLGVATDITLQKQASLQMREAKEAAEAATRAKSAFLANMSHEIRTPMNAVIGMTGLLTGTNLSPEQREYVETIRTGGDSLLTVINDILDFSKIESGKLDLEHNSFNLRVCVEEALDLLAARAFDKGLELICEIEKETPHTIVGDITRLRQVLVNLLGNAVKFTESGEVAIGVRSRALGGGRCEILFAVKDTGIGIPEDKLGVLFQSFSQVDASTTKLYGGTGLGLAISKRLTELMGGKISVESFPGIGSTFQFTIRVDVSPAHRFESPDQICALLVQKRVLIVDDNETSRDLLYRQANAWGMLAETARGGREALERIDGGEKFDCVVLDMGMPGMDGSALTEELRRRVDWQRKPLVVLLSGTASKQNLGDRKANDARVSYVSKPTKSAQLRQALVELFSNQALVEAPTPAAATEPAKSSEEKMRLRVLLAEDNLVNQKVALRMLSRIGYKADVAANGLEALEALSRQPYDVVLMDMQMPQMDGLEATRQIHQRWGKESRPWIIAMTANAMEGDREMCLRTGMDDYISKPVKLSDLETALKQAEAREKVASSE